MKTAIHGDVAGRFDNVREAFAMAFEGNPDMGASLAIVHRGELVVDLWGGVADYRDRSPWQPDTPSVIFSCTKGLVSILAARLVQDGLLDYEAPVSRYWREFAQAGKHNVRVKHLLSHRSGLSAPRKDLTTEDILQWDSVAELLADQEPLWVPDSGYAYHAITHGWLIGEVIRRVTGVSVGKYFRDLIAEPLKVDAWIGLPKEPASRVAHMLVGPTLSQLLEQQAAALKPNAVDWPTRASTLGGALPPALIGEDSGFNDPRIQSAEIPGAGGIATARAIATIWSATFENSHGASLLSPETIREATTVQTEGPPVFDTPGPWPRWGMGFQLDSETRRFVTQGGYGHDGAGGQVAFADPAEEVGFAFLTSQMEGVGDVRGTRIVDALRTALAS